MAADRRPGTAGQRLDQALVARGMVRSRAAAQALVRAGRVRVAGRVVTRSSHSVLPGDDLVADVDPWVGRGAHKLIGALDHFAVAVPAVALDAGASTGGFTQVLLSRGAVLVHAVDVGHGQLDPVLRRDPRVRNVEGFNLRRLSPRTLGPPPPGLVVADVSFISLTLLAGPLLSVLHGAGGEAVLLVKPQFEVGREALARSGGVVREEDERLAAVAGVAAALAAAGGQVLGTAPSVLPGERGNQEYFLHCRVEPTSGVVGGDR